MQLSGMKTLASYFFSISTLAYLLLSCTSARCLYIVWVEGQICVDSREEVARSLRHRISFSICRLVFQGLGTEDENSIENISFKSEKKENDHC